MKSHRGRTLVDTKNRIAASVVHKDRPTQLGAVDSALEAAV